MPRITIDLREDAFQRLQQLALSERRPTRDQAAWMIEQRLAPQPPRDTREVASGLAN